MKLAGACSLKNAICAGFGALSTKEPVLVDKSVKLSRVRYVKEVRKVLIFDLRRNKQYHEKVFCHINARTSRYRSFVFMFANETVLRCLQWC